jgi:thioesterase domain-containing protein
MPPSLGLSWCYFGLTRELDENVPVYGLQAGTDRPLPETLEEMAVWYVERMRTVAPTGPYHLLGYSIGGNVAHAVATVLQQQGEQVGLLAILDARPGDPAQDCPVERQRPPGAADVLATMADGPGAAPDPVRQRTVALQRLAEAVGELADEDRLDVMINSIRVVVGHRPSRYKGDVTLVASGDRGAALKAAWTPYVDGEIRLATVDCEHHDLLLPGPLARVAETVAPAIR